MALSILWADDEIQSLKSHILFLQQKGFSVTSVTNGEDAISLIQEKPFDLVLVDEHMPGINGLDTLARIKDLRPSVPVVMITKSEEESIMNEAIGSKIADYLIKPVNPNQILLTIKRLFDSDRITSQKSAQEYLQNFSAISQKAGKNATFQEWVDVYKKLTSWQFELEGGDPGLYSVLLDQFAQANVEFAKFIEKNYPTWLQTDKANRPLLSPDILPEYILPRMKNGESIVFILVDCMRYDQWVLFEQLIGQSFDVKTDFYASILPTATPYSRNAIFAGLYPDDIARKFPELWTNAEDDEHSLNRHEHELLTELLTRNKLSSNAKYAKIVHSDDGKKVLDNLNHYLQSPLSAFVFNFVDTLVHTRSDNTILKEIAPDEKAFRSLTQTWFEHSHLLQLLKILADKNITVVLTTDHGSVRTLRDTIVKGDRHTSTALRYKYGRNLGVKESDAIVVTKPKEYRLPENLLSPNYIFAKEDYYFLYPTNYHKYQNRYKDTFQHGGVSMEEMLLPVSVLTPKKR